MKNKIRDAVWGPAAWWPGKGRMDLRPGCWAFAFDPNGIGFHPQFPITAHQLCSVFIKFSVWKCGGCFYFVLVLFGFLTARRICVFLGFCLSLSCTAIFCLLCCCELGNEAPSFLRNIHYLHAFSNFQQSQLFLEWIRWFPFWVAMCCLLNCFFLPSNA